MTEHEGDGRMTSYWESMSLSLGRRSMAEHVHEWEVEYLPDPMSAGGVVRSGDLACACGASTPDTPDGPA